MNTTDAVNNLLDEHGRLTRRLDVTNATLGAAEALLRRVARLLPHVIGTDAQYIVAHAVVRAEIDEFLNEDRDHPAYPIGDLEDFTAGPDPEGEAGDGPAVGT